MATIILLARPSGAGIGPGRLISPVIPRGIASQMGVTIDALDVDWDGNPDLLISFTIDHSPDNGATWLFLVGGQTHGGARSRIGTLPSISIDLPLTATHMRGTLSLSKRSRIGLIGEIT